MDAVLDELEECVSGKDDIERQWEMKELIAEINQFLQKLPEEMAPYVTRLDFIIGVQMSYHNNCSVVSYGGVTAINMIRSIKEPELERRFFTRLVELGLDVTLESNGE